MVDNLDKNACEYGKILSGLWLLDRLADTKDFIEFYNKATGTYPDKRVFAGFQFLVELLVRNIYCGIEQSIDNFELVRRLHYGENNKSISDFAERNPDLRLLKEINKRRRALLEASEWKQLESLVRSFVSEFNRKLNRKIKKNVQFSKKFSKEEIEKYVSIYWLWISGHEIQMPVRNILGDAGHSFSATLGQPIQWWAYTLDNRISPERLANVIHGYAVTLEYLWSKLLTPKLFGSANLHKLANVETWDEVRRFLFVIKDNVIAGINAEIGCDLDNCVLLERRVVRKNDRLIPSKRITSRKQIMDLFLNYRVEVIRHWGAGDVFRGAGLFVSLVTGCCLNYDDKVMIIKFVHPQCDVKGNNYSYAILIQAAGTWDYSGWILLYDCCGDFSGFSGSQYAWIEGTIKGLQKRLEIKEITVDKGLLESAFKDLDPKERSLNDFKKLSQDVKGLLLEFLSIYYFAKKSPRFIKWSFSDSEILPSHKEIDLLAIIENTLYLVECEFSFSTTMEKLVEELKCKRSCLEKRKDLFSAKYAGFDEIKEVAFFAIRGGEIYRDFIKPLREAGIEVMTLDNLQLTKEERIKLAKIFDRLLTSGRIRWNPFD